MFAHWSVMRERSIAAIFWKNCFSVIKHNPFQWAYLTSALWAKRGKRRGIYVGCKLREAWEGICQRKFPTEVRVAAQRRVSTKFLKLKQSITREKLSRNPQKGRLSLRQDLKGKTSKKSKSTQSESKATKKTAVIKELEKHFEKSEITVHCRVEISKGNDPKGDLNHHIGKHFTKWMKAFALPVLEGKKKWRKISAILSQLLGTLIHHYF